MEHGPLGRTGVSVSKFCLGAMMFGAWGNPDHDESVRIVHRALDAGVNFIDTADVYAQGESEEIVAKALTEGRRDEVVLATKFHGAMGGDPNQQGSSRRWIIREVEDSLRRLNTDWIDLYQVHRPRTDTDIEETLGALSDLVHQGKVRYIGSSTFPASQIVEAQWVARDRQPAQARCRRTARPARRGGGDHAHPAGDRVRPQPPRRHRADHRAADHGAAREPAGGGRRRPRPGGA
jgi:aryl-alcohol dehydrogenase-like predicted oxidoreductase